MADYIIDAVEEAIEVLSLIARNPGLGVTELSVRSGNTKARTFRMLRTLEKNGLVFRSGQAPIYTLGLKVLYLGLAAEGQIALARAARSCMRELGAACDETVQLRIRDGTESICVARWEASHRLQMLAKGWGARRPLYVGASGKVLLSHAPQDIKDSVFSMERISYTKATLVGRSNLKQAMHKIAQAGYGVSHGELVADAVSIAAPIRDANAEVVAAISVAGPASRLAREDMQGTIDLVVGAARKLSDILGYRDE
ncbi:transcriptional regulator [Herbaspirillum sp. CF444]|uniref:IclR family transcriptional regulator n=1 Tax=Herbaspirillum sp. CF444 TaxID=1144319 RepID=UPI0002727438|nr:IclR family transcriptional regulator [Herbaspirillum sp. CF444]EJL81905.1 transcriptional regulator [Herbaspirillum sp. CF444]